MKYKIWVNEWLKRKEKFVKESTFASYSNILVNHLIPHFGELDLINITEDLVQKYAIDLLQNGRIDKNGGLADRSVKDIIVVLKNSLKDAMRNKYIPTSVFEIKFPPSRREEKIKVISQVSQQKLMQAIYLNLNRKTIGIMICLYSGLRIGEICSLKNSDIDLENKILRVSKTLQRIYCKHLDGSGKSKIVISSPKSKTSIREIPISQILLPLLKRVWTDASDSYFISGTEKFIEVRTYRSYFLRFLEKNNITPFNFHCLRHTFATRCIEAGADCKTVSELLGHSTVNMTLNLYVHPQLEQKRKCIDLLM